MSKGGSPLFLFKILYYRGGAQTPDQKTRTPSCYTQYHEPNRPMSRGLTPDSSFCPCHASRSCGSIGVTSKQFGSMVACVVRFARQPTWLEFNEGSFDF